jgi:hypothetical protein
MTNTLAYYDTSIITVVKAILLAFGIILLKQLTMIFKTGVR